VRAQTAEKLCPEKVVLDWEIPNAHSGTTEPMDHRKDMLLLYVPGRWTNPLTTPKSQTQLQTVLRGVWVAKRAVIPGTHREKQGLGAHILWAPMIIH
jgi:hypothetical protein